MTGVIDTRIVAVILVLAVALGCNREAALDDFSVSSLAGIGVGDDIRAYVDGADGVDLDAILSAQGNADIRKLRSVNQKGVAKVRGVLVERGSGKIARASAVLDAWDGRSSRKLSRAMMELVSRHRIQMLRGGVGRLRFASGRSAKRIVVVCIESFFVVKTDIGAFGRKSRTSS